MTWALIRIADNAWMGGPIEAKPVAPAGQRVIPVALGYPDSAVWSAAKGAFVDLMSEDQCLAQVDARAAALRGALQTLSPGMADVYRRKMIDVAALNTLGGTTALILAALKAMPPAQQQSRFPFLYAEMQAAALADLTVARDRIVAASDAAAQPLATIELYRRRAKVAIRAATSLAAKNAAATGAAWPA